MRGRVRCGGGGGGGEELSFFLLSKKGFTLNRSKFFQLRVIPFSVRGIHVTK